jgi:hypothetical protein
LLNTRERIPVLSTHRQQTAATNQRDKKMTTAFKIAALNALSKSNKSSDILAVASIRVRTKAKELKVGDIVKNIITKEFYPVASIDKDSLCYLVTLDCCTSVGGSAFTMDLVGDFVDVYAA